MIVFRRRLQVRWKQGLAKSRLEAQRCRAVPLSHSHEQVFRPRAAKVLTTDEAGRWRASPFVAIR